MRVQVLLPQWGMGMRDGTVTGWLKHEGDHVSKGDELVEIETDKVSSAVEASADGTLVRIVAQPGDVVEVLGLLGEIEAAADGP